MIRRIALGATLALVLALTSLAGTGAVARADGPQSPITFSHPWVAPTGTLKIMGQSGVDYFLDWAPGGTASYFLNLDGTPLTFTGSTAVPYALFTGNGFPINQPTNIYVCTMDSGACYSLAINVTLSVPLD